MLMGGAVEVNSGVIVRAYADHCPFGGVVALRRPAGLVDDGYWSGWTARTPVPAYAFGVRVRRYRPAGCVAEGRAAWMAWTAVQECPKRSSSVAVTAASVSHRTLSTARCDPLTGLLGRDGFTAKARQITDRYGDHALVGIVDLDHFKQINDGPGGHAAGDRVLAATARP
ncbi:diguanylate cyclase (GGDEF)-like protein [Streptomyces sp. T12]|nr:diguanylate cyclase (GGDEF)-like protein [Streptomyces sp. T12]